jgi:hypothetical protein
VAVFPTKDHSTTPTAIITKMSVHVELEEAPRRGTPTHVVTVSRGGPVRRVGRSCDGVVVIFTKSVHSLIQSFNNRYVYVFENFLISSEPYAVGDRSYLLKAFFVCVYEHIL